MWFLVAACLTAWVAIRLGLFSPFELVATDAGPRWLPNALAGVDHPFHIARAETVRRALLDGELLRWISHHQGGYPVEFYPLGVAWLEVAIWLITFGALPIAHAHTIVITLIFLAPGIAYATMTSQDRWPPRVIVIALVLHIVVPGDWWHGGYTELVQWGLVTNVAGAVFALLVLAFLTRFVETGRGTAVAVAALASAGAIYANPRSLIALAAVGVAVWLAAVSRPRAGRPSTAMVSIRVGMVALIGACLAAPELLSLVRFSRLYQFVRYERYDDLGEFVQSSVNAVSQPVLLLALFGIALSLVRFTHPAARTAAISLLLYALITVALAGDLGGLAQLEPTRLMPFQRLLTFYLAAVAIEAVIGWITRWLGQRAETSRQLVALALVAALVVARGGIGSAEMPTPAQTDPLATALYPVERAAVSRQADLEEAIRLADAAAAPGTSLLVIGSALSWHQQLWAPLWTGRPLIYDDWLWYWHDAHAGTPGYAWEGGHHYPDPAAALDPAYLSRHGIGAVVVTGPVAEPAATASWLEPRRTGVYDVFVARDPTTLVTFAGSNADDLAMSANRVSATGTSDGGTVTIRQNWYPRWRATVNGEPATISRTDDGYMSVKVPPGPISLVLAYEVDAIDWLARILAAAGLIATISLVVWRGRLSASIVRNSPLSTSDICG